MGKQIDAMIQAAIELGACAWRLAQTRISCFCSGICHFSQHCIRRRSPLMHHSSLQLLFDLLLPKHRIIAQYISRITTAKRKAQIPFPVLQQGVTKTYVHRSSRALSTLYIVAVSLLVHSHSAMLLRYETDTLDFCLLCQPSSSVHKKLRTFIRSNLVATLKSNLPSVAYFGPWMHVSSWGAYIRELVSNTCAGKIEAIPKNTKRGQRISHAHDR